MKAEKKKSKGDGKAMKLRHFAAISGGEVEGVFVVDEQIADEFLQTADIVSSRDDDGAVEFDAVIDVSSMEDSKRPAPRWKAPGIGKRDKKLGSIIPEDELRAAFSAPEEETTGETGQ